MTFARLTLIAFSLSLLLDCFAVLMKFLAGLDRVQALWHQRTPAFQASLAWRAEPDVTHPG
jgi:hypothetical protein